MNLMLSNAAAEVGIIAPAFAIIRGVTISSDESVYEKEIQNLGIQLLKDINIIKTSKVFIGFTMLFNNLGYPNQITAGDRLLNSITSKGFKFINNVVDVCNIVSATHGYGIGLHDADKLSGDILIKRASGNEKIKPIFKEKYVDIPEGDLLYSSGDNIMAWLGKRDVDSDDYKVSETTTNLLIAALGNENTNAHFNQMICSSVFNLLSRENPSARIDFLEVFRQ